MAELRIFLLLAGDGLAPSERDPGLIAWSPRFPALPREGRRQARFGPSHCSGGMLWTVTITSTLAITVASGVPYRMIALILAIELTGLAASATWARWRRRQGRNRM
jgi:hypothetical protein